MIVKKGLMGRLWPSVKVKSTMPEIPLLRKIKQEHVIVLLSILAIMLQLFIVVNVTTAQEKQPAGLQIGDKVPDVTITHMINYKAPTAKISDFKGKLLILDFWATWCSPCIAMIPKMDSLQKEFNSKVQFLPVTYQTEKEVEPFLVKLQKQKPFNLPDVTGDKVLHNLFPHRTLPHYVWIDANGIVKAITGFEEVNAKNIEDMLGEKRLALQQKKDVRVPYDFNKPLFINGNGGNGGSIVFHSLLSHYNEGLPSVSHVIKEGNTISRIAVTNFPLPFLFSLAYNENRNDLYLPNRLITEVADSSKLYFNNWTDKERAKAWMNQNSWCYELKVPDALSPQAFKIMQEDLRKFFPYDVQVEKRRMNCLMLVTVGKGKHFQSAGGKPEVTHDFYHLSLKNSNIYGVVALLAGKYMQNLTLPMIDATGYTGKADIEINAKLSDLAAVRKELQKYDLDLQEGIRNIDMIVVKDRKSDQ